MASEYEEFYKKIGYRFKDESLLVTALTHTSFSNEQHGAPICSNERFEFLGDSVLSVLVSSYLFKTYPDYPEGDLTAIKAGLVCTAALSKYAEMIGLGDYLKLGHGEEKGGGRKNHKLLENAFEALLAAIYLDSGENWQKDVGDFLLPFIKKDVVSGHKTDPKTELQQLVQQTEGDCLEYVIVDESGPDHKKTFIAEARLNSNVIGRGTGSSKKEAEKNAAKEALDLFGVKI